MVKTLEAKSAARSFAIIDSETLIVGENEGWFEVIKINSNIDLVQIIYSTKFEAVGHVFTMEMTIEPS